MEKKLLQITAGVGPAECCLVVSRVLEYIKKEAKSYGLNMSVLETVAGHHSGTSQSVILEVQGADTAAFITRWQGTVQWIAQSPYRKLHKRKNWYIGIEAFDSQPPIAWDSRDVELPLAGPQGRAGKM